MSRPVDLAMRQPVSPEHAILVNDVDELQRCLDLGWSVEGPATQDGRPTYPLADRIVFRGWLEGWQLLCRHWPELRFNPDLIHRAFTRFQAPILRDLFDEDVIRVDGYVFEGKTALMLAIESLDIQEVFDETSKVPVEQRVVATFELLIERGADPYALYPGAFTPGDTSCRGHSAWTRALDDMHWPLALRLMPTRLEDVEKQPRIFQAIEQLSEEAASPHQKAKKILQNIYELWVERFGAWWFAQPHTVVPQHPRDWDFILKLPQAARLVIWETWGRPGDHDVNVFHDLALEAKRREVIPILEGLLADIGEPEGWLHPSAEGVRPCDLWAMVLNQPVPETPWTLAQALEMTRRHGQGFRR